MDQNWYSNVVKLLEYVPDIQNENTRTAFLVGMPSIHRDHNNYANDIELIVGQLANMELANGKIALAIFIDHALHRAEGLAIATELRDLRDQLRTHTVTEVAPDTSPTASTETVRAEHEQHEPHHDADSPEQQQKHSANLSSNGLLALAHQYIEVAKTSVETAAKPFTGKGHIPPVKFKEAIELLHTTQEQMRDLQALVKHILSLPSEKALDKVAARYSDIDRKTYIIIEEAGSLITSSENEEHFNRLDITQKSTRLIADLNELDRSFESEEASS